MVFPFVMKHRTDNYEDNNIRFQKSNAYKIMMGKPHRKQQLARQRGRGIWEGNMKMDLNKMCCEDERWM
jgi:hypothetical protein